MPDKLTIEQRSRNMACIRGKDTKPEMIVRKFLWSRGFRYRLNHNRLPGKPDIVLRKYRTCIFVNGCFWHGHRCLTPNPSPTRRGEQEDPETRHSILETLQSSECCKIPTTRREFWVAKIMRNQQRDIEVQKKLAEMGWHCVTVWECSLKQKPLTPLPHKRGRASCGELENTKTLRERTLESLEYTLNKIYLQDHRLKRYELPEEERQIAAERDPLAGDLNAKRQRD